MNVPVLSELVDFIEGIFKHTAPTVVTAAEQAAAGAAVETAEADPKVQAVTTGAVALLTAAQNLKQAINAADAPAAAPQTEESK
jgi:hypothetical protein